MFYPPNQYPFSLTPIRGLPMLSLGGPMNTCQMPDCAMEVKPDQKYCDACEWLKNLELTLAMQ